MRRLLTLAAQLVVACGGGSADAPVDLPDASVDVDAPASDSGVRVLDLGTVTSMSTVSFAIPEHTLGFRIEVTIDGAQGNEHVGVETVTSPENQRVVDGYATIGHPASTGASTVGVATVAVPQSSDAAAMPVVPGTWTARLYVQDGKTARARVYVRTTSDGEFHGGTLDVRIYVPDGLVLDGGAITAADAPTHAGAQARVDAFYATLGSTFQLDRGAVEFLPIDARFATIGDIDQLRAGLAATTSFADGLGVHFVWTGDLTLYETKVWGNSGNIPGAPAADPRGLAGVVVDISSTYPPAADGMTMVHELGHFLGLFHTSEASRTIHDTLADTPACTTAVAVCPDARNIMFPSFYGASGGVGITASAQQRRVVWGSSIYRQDGNTR